MTIPARLPSAQSKRWQFLRAGIQNVWEYDNQRFVFHRGRLMLRGQNESGKTKALEVLLPFLLDASLQPHRLDPFGSSARSMRWNLLNDAHPSVTVAIGYVWLELGRVTETGAEYWTLGAGLKARRTSPQLDDWYFATSRRVDDSLQLVVNSLPLTRPQLEAAIGSDGSVFDNAAHYRRTLNDKLFGLSDDQYAALIDALLQLRRPQLSKGLDPHELSRILSASLPPLDGQVIGTLAEGFERLDRHRAERDECRDTLESVRSFLAVYRQYAAAVAKGRALEVTRSDSSYHAARTKQKDVEGQQEAVRAKLAEINERLAELDAKAIGLDEQLKVLRESDAYRAVAELDAAEQQATDTRTSAARAADASEKGRARAERKRHGVAASEERADEDARELASERSSAVAAAEACELVEAHEAMAEALERGETAVARDTLQVSLRLRTEAIETLRRLTRQLDDATRALDAATALAKAAEHRVSTAIESARRAADAESVARNELFEQVETWAATCTELRVDASTIQDAVPEQMRSLAATAADMARIAIEELLRSATLVADTAVRELEATRKAKVELEAQRHQPPPAPAWRPSREPGRPGAPFYLLCDFLPEVEPEARAGLEAALEASGLLDAWVTPEGDVLDATTFDSVLAARPAVEGESLARVLRPVEGGAVSMAQVDAMLRSIGLGVSPAPAWVAADGRFALGPLEGRNGKPAPAFLGAAARERARREKLAELAAAIARFESSVAERNAAVAAIQTRRTMLDRELAAFPDVQPLRDRQAELRARTNDLTEARREHQEEIERLDRAKTARVAAARTLDDRAGALCLRGWTARLDELVDRTATWRSRASTLLAAFERTQRSHADVEASRAELDELSREAERLEQAAKEEQRHAIEAAARAEALRATVGKDRETLLASLRETENRKRQTRVEIEQCSKAREEALIKSATLESAFEGAKQKVQESDAGRAVAEQRFRLLEARGILAVVGVEQPGPLHSWSWTDVLITARRVGDATATTDASEDGRDKAWNRVSERHQELMRSVKPDLKVLPSQADGLTVYEVSFNARRLTLLELHAELEADLAARNHLLDDEERGLFESFLTGEAHEHLRERLRDADALVTKMNGQLDSHPTSSGMVMRLSWEVAEDAAPGTKEAVALMFKSGALMADSDREALLTFLRERLDEARTGGELARSLQEQMLSVLDYRRWHTFAVECQADGGPWKRMTKKVHAAGSGGQKAVMLHLPLFAAAAAFYDSARSGAPRFILLDEAFAGIDRQTRGELMGLLADFDLDFVMTSFEEWGFYPQLDGLSTYHLAREKGMPGVYADWFVWNGHEPVQMQP